jgi:trigger factor
MNIQIKDINSFTKEVEVNVAWEDLGEVYKTEFNQFRKKISMSGYRKGKVPTTLVKSNYGKSFDVDFIDKNLNIYYQKAISEQHIHPISKPKISDLDFSEGSELKFKATVEVVPQYNLPKYDKIKINLIRLTPTKADMDKSLEEIQSRQSTLKTLDQGAETGNYVECDLQEIDEAGLPVIGKKQDGRFLRLGEGYIQGEAEKSLIGIKADENRKVVVTMDDDSKVTYDIHARKVQELIKPELNDEFAKIADENVSSLKELKANIQKQIDKSLEEDYLSAKQGEIINWFVVNTDLEPPTSMVDNYIDNMITELKTKSPEAKTMDEATLRKIYQKRGEDQIKWYLIQEKLMDAEKIEISENELKTEIQNQIDEFKDVNPDVIKYFKKPQNKKRFQEELEVKRLFDKIESFTTIKETKKTTDQFRKEQEKAKGAK